MRDTAVLAVALFALVSACGKPSSPAEPPPGAVSPEASSTPPAPSALTDAQKKALLAGLPAAYQIADLDNGQAKFAICKTCHTPNQGGGNMTGPNLWGVFGRKSGTSPGFAYSDGMKSLGVVWDADKINQWISNPRAMVPGTKMTYIGLENPKDRIDVVAYLKTVTSPPPAS
jgi:cytochrome c